MCSNILAPQHHACGHGVLGPPWLPERCACTVSCLPLARSSTRTSLPTALIREGVSQMVISCEMTLVLGYVYHTVPIPV